MADPPLCPAYTGAPRWVRVSAILAAVVVLLLILLMILSGGRHGPGRHLRTGGAGVSAPAESGGR